MSENQEAAAIRLTRIYSDSDKSRFAELELETKSVVRAPAAPPLKASARFASHHVQMMIQSPGWQAGWQPAARRSLLLILAGEFGVEVGNGERRQFRAGDVVLVEDRSGQGHRGWVVGDANLVAAIVQLSDDAQLRLVPPKVARVRAS